MQAATHPGCWTNGLVLGDGGDVSREGQSSQESFELLLGGQCLVLSADDLSHPLDGLSCMHNALINNALCSCLFAMQCTNQPSHNQSWQ